MSYSVPNEKSDPEIIIDKNKAHIFSIQGNLKGFQETIMIIKEYKTWG